MMSPCGKVEKVSFRQKGSLYSDLNQCHKASPVALPIGIALQQYLAGLSCMLIEGGFCFSETRTGRQSWEHHGGV